MHTRPSFLTQISSLGYLAALAALLALLGYAFAGSTGLMWILMLSAVVLLFGRRASLDQMLRWQGARPLSRRQAPHLHAIIDDLTRRARLPQAPRLYLVRSNAMNAFAVGMRNDHAIGITTGLVRNLDERELTGVLAHEMSHIVHNDTGLLTVANTISRMTRSASTVGKLLLFLNLPLLLMGQAVFSWSAVLLMIFAPTISSLLQLALTRTREYEADRGAVRLTGDARGLAQALYKLDRQQRGIFGRFFNPIHLIPKAFRSHPLTSDRIARLGGLQRPQVVFA